MEVKQFFVGGTRNGDFVKWTGPIRGTGCVVLLSLAAVISGCATPKAPEPRGKWRPVNQLSEQPQAIPLQQAYVYQASPADGTLKNMLTRWARDAGLTLAYQHPNDYTLYAPVANIRTSSLAEAAAALSAAYAAQNVVVAVDRGRIVVSVAGSPADAGAAAVVDAPATNGK